MSSSAQPAESLEKHDGAAFWDANPCGGDWSSYAQFLAWYQRTEPYIYEVLDRYAWAGRVVVEVGCGQGTIANYIAPRGARVTAIDMSGGSVARTRAGAREMGHAERVRLALADAERLPFADGSFEIAVSCGVLHHSPDTATGVREIGRVLRPGGRAIVMLYRTGNPKWWATRLARAVSRVVDRSTGRQAALAARLRDARTSDSAAGTALLELFGVPILRAFSNDEARALFAGFDEVRVTNHQPGFRRLADIAPALRPLEPMLSAIDRATVRTWGFYQVIEASRPV
jgi:SAM-dependent methyltransferase